VLYDLAAPRPTNLLAPLRTIPAVRDVTLFGERIHLLVDRELSPDELLARIPVSSPDAKINVVAPSLEDVFVTLTRMADRVGVEQLIAERGMSRAEPSRGAARSEETPDPSPGHSRSAVSAQLGERRSRGKLRHHGDLAGFFAILRKEFVHIRRQPTTLFFMLLVPVLQTIIFGYAINTRIENIPSAVLNFDGRRASELLIEAFRNSRAFDLASDVHDEAALNAELQSGRAQVGIVIPPDFSDRLLRGEQATLQVLVDGSDSQVATAAQHSTALIGQAVSIQLARAKAESLQLAAARDWEGKAVLPIDVRTRLLYNPDLDSSHFFVPGLVGVVLQLVTLFLTSFAIVRERELGTLEQLFVTPVGRSGLMFGKLVPYAIVGFVEVVLMLTVMIYVFRVDIAGNVGLLLGLSLLFTVCSLGLGLFVSTVARTQLEGFQVAFVLMLPSILLSGFVFPRGEMPTPIYWLTFVLPATYFIEILRGIILRGAPAQDLLVPIVGLSCCCVVVLAAAIARFQKRLA
jgi:ABC transporter DrrB family efflux protein